MFQITLLAKRAATMAPHGLATSYQGRNRSWRQFVDRVARLAGGLQALGIGENDRVAILARNSDRMLELFYAVPWAGGVFVPLNIRSSRAELEFCVANSGAKLIILDMDFEEWIPDLLRLGVRHAVSIDGPANTDLETVDGLVEKSPAAADSERRNDDLAGIFYTAGTTGDPKGVMLSHGNMLANLFNLLHSFHLDQNTRLLHATPMFHIAGAFNLFAPTVMAGQHHFLPKFDAAQVLDAIERFRITFITLVPTMLNMLIDQPNFSTRDLSSLKELFYGGSPISQSALQRALTMMPHVRLNQGFGLTETSPTVTFLTYEDHIRNGVISPKHKSAGRPVATVQVRIVDDEDKDLPQGEVGEICVAGNTVMKGYWNNSAETEKALRGGVVPHR